MPLINGMKNPFLSHRDKSILQLSVELINLHGEREREREGERRELPDFVSVETFFVWLLLFRCHIVSLIDSKEAFRT